MHPVRVIVLLDQPSWVGASKAVASRLWAGRCGLLWTAIFSTLCFTPEPNGTLTAPKFTQRLKGLQTISGTLSCKLLLHMVPNLELPLLTAQIY